MVTVSVVARVRQTLHAVVRVTAGLCAVFNGADLVIVMAVADGMADTENAVVIVISDDIAALDGA
jgi:hypothetical protein